MEGASASSESRSIGAASRMTIVPTRGTVPRFQMTVPNRRNDQGPVRSSLSCLADGVGASSCVLVRVGTVALGDQDHSQSGRAAIAAALVMTMSTASSGNSETAYSSSRSSTFAGVGQDRGGNNVDDYLARDACGIGLRRDRER